ncbi:MAG: preprotein translocase subunit SecG [Planctomycetota bacterium]
MLAFFQMPAWAVQLFVVAFLAICVVMVLTVLIQRPQGGGLSGAFGAGSGGGGGAGQTAFGARTGDALTFATIGIFVIYLICAIILVGVARTAAVPPNEEPQASAPITTEDALADDLADDLAEVGAEEADASTQGDEANPAVPDPVGADIAESEDGETSGGEGTPPADPQ